MRTLSIRRSVIFLTIALLVSVVNPDVDR